MEADNKDYYSRPYTQPGYSMTVCSRQLMGEFTQIYSDDIQKILLFFQGQYAKAHMALSRVMVVFNKTLPFNEKIKQNVSCTARIKLINDYGESKFFVLRRMPALRKTSEVPFCPESLQLEIDFVNTQKKSDMATSQPSPDIPDNGKNIQCDCCFANFEFEEMVQCADCHLVCKDCLNSYVKEVIYGSSKVEMKCLAEGCTMNYPDSELRRCLETSIWEKLEERGMMENVNMAGFDDLVSCPGCNFKAIMSPTSNMFLCRNLDCQKAVCRKCGIDWNDHVGLLCNEVEKKDEAALRKEYEEKMTIAKIRTCMTCKAEFLKENGCNKLTCRCGTTMCYICRKSYINYNHFCSHPRDPGQPCKQCSACSLWTDPEEDEKKAIEEIRKEASEKQKYLGFSEKIIGAPDSPNAAN
ncbi:hypothetical protein Btru_035689 [Bulinus truncatus]|nr:hypothetical protein Btru_035689 [Bulinus truncatus]